MPIRALAVLSLLPLAACAGEPDPAPLAVAVPVDPALAEVWREQREIRRQIERGRETGQLSRREARGLRRSSAQIGAAAERLAADGLSESEARDLAIQTRALEDLVDARRFGTGFSDPR